MSSARLRGGDMDDEGLSFMGNTVDYTTVPPMEHKKLLGSINQFIMRTSSFLNRFASVCTEKLDSVSHRIRQLEIDVTILESKLGSIPELEGVTGEQYVSTTNTPALSSSAPTATSSTAESAPAAAQPAAQQPPVAVADAGAGAGAPAPPPAAEQEAPAPQAPVMTNRQHPNYIRFFKMLDVGVPEPAVKAKMAAEGFDTSILDNPDAPCADSSAGGGGGGGGGGDAGDSDDSDESEDSSASSDEDEQEDDSFDDSD